MNWSFNIINFFIGLLILAGGGLIVFFHRQIADNLASGVSSYDRTKLVGVIVCVLGFLVATNLHTTILDFLVNLIFH